VQCAALLVAGASVAACGPARPTGATAVETATSFYAAIDRQDGAAACALLAPATTESLESDADEPCDEAVLDGEVGATLASRAAGSDGSASLAGRQAQVLRADDVVFLTVSGTAWRITAAGCDARPDRPYDCVLEGA
jgi:hypothetical protein